MSVQHRPVQWNRHKYVYDAILLAGIGVYVLLFTRYGAALADFALDGATTRMRAFGSLAFLLLTLILCIGPLARLDRRFLPLLYNRRHFGVLTFFVALAHVAAVFGWYLAFSPTDPYVALLTANTAADRILAFPFEWLGMGALAILFAMMATSHDFWLRFLGPPVWKTLHMSVYLAYALVVLHMALGVILAEPSPFYPIMLGASLAAVLGLHLAAARREAGHDRSATLAPAADRPGWLVACRIADIPPERGITRTLPGGERIALFRHGGRISAISNLCAHQNGPLGEGRILDGCVTCPWHGFQYRPEDGCAPPPFSEKIATYRVRRRDDDVLIDPQPLAPGTWTQPIELGP